VSGGSESQSLITLARPVSFAPDFCTALPCNLPVPAGKRPRFESPILHSTGLHHLAPGRNPLHNRGFLMRGQFGLRPPAKQNGRLLTLFLTPFWRTLPLTLPPPVVPVEMRGSPGSD
jgi:hypothetical protein